MAFRLFYHSPSNDNEKSSTEDNVHGKPAQTKRNVFNVRTDLSSPNKQETNRVSQFTLPLFKLAFGFAHETQLNAPLSKARLKSEKFFCTMQIVGSNKTVGPFGSSRAWKTRFIMPSSPIQLLCCTSRPSSIHLRVAVAAATAAQAFHNHPHTTTTSVRLHILIHPYGRMWRTRAKYLVRVRCVFGLACNRLTWIVARGVPYSIGWRIVRCCALLSCFVVPASPPRPW